MMRTRGRWAWVAGFAVAVLGCGTNWEATCAQVAPCGGDVVGEWSFVGACINEDAVRKIAQANCPGASIDITAISISGTLDFAANLTFTGTTQQTLSAHELVPRSCFNEPLTTCAAASVNVVIEGRNESITCTGDTICDCTLTRTISRATTAGTYSVSGNTLSTSGGVGGTSLGTGAYCVQGKLLHLVEVIEMDTGPMGMVTIGTDFVAERQ